MEKYEYNVDGSLAASISGTTYILMLYLGRKAEK